MNGLLQGFILGLVQGLTEFLPVSSSGHLLLLEHFGVGEESLFVNLALHIATLLSVCIALRKELLEVIKNPFGEEMRFLLLSAVPTALIALAIRKFCPLEADMLPFFFILTSAVLILPNVIKRNPVPLTGKTCIKDALIAGAAQGIACFSGLSRSGTTVSCLALCGVEENKRAKLSFLMSVPVILGSAIVEFAGGGAKNVNVSALMVGAVTAFLVGLVAIKIFIKIVEKNKMWIFSIYTFLLGIGSFVTMFVL